MIENERADRGSKERNEMEITVKNIVKKITRTNLNTKYRKKANEIKNRHFLTFVM